MARRLRQVIDLYTEGATVVLRDDLPVWVQPLNPFEQDTARNEANIAKSRVTLAIREHDEEEKLTVRTFFFEDGEDKARERLVDAKVNENATKVFTSIRTDPEWRERMQILDRGDENTAKPLGESEVELLQRIALEYSAELGKRLDSERDYWTSHYAGMDAESLWEDYFAWWIDRRAGEVMLSEFRQHQVLFGVRLCDATRLDETSPWNHSACDHKQCLFANHEELRAAPGALLQELFDAVDSLDMTVHDAKNSRRQGSSSDSSPLPSEAAESTASTQDGTPPERPGFSSTPSLTPSPSSAGTS